MNAVIYFSGWHFNYVGEECESLVSRVFPVNEPRLCSSSNVLMHGAMRERQQTDAASAVPNEADKEFEQWLTSAARLLIVA